MTNEATPPPVEPDDAPAIDAPEGDDGDAVPSTAPNDAVIANDGDDDAPLPSPIPGVKTP